MDPQANVTERRLLAALILERGARDGEAERLAELVEADLDWRAMGGFEAKEAKTR